MWRSLVAHLTPVTYLDRTAAIYPDHTAVECEGTSWTYREFHQQVRQLAGALSATVAPGQTVSVVAPNLPEMLVAHFAVPMLGEVLNPLNPRLTSAEFRYILDHAEARIVFVDPDVADRLAPVCTELGIEMITLDEQHHRPAERCGVHPPWGLFGRSVGCLPLRL
ncbi:AMP-binding protein [Auritidibacter sp. NML120636]|uniref:AMP-binding protein n=1 Tax=Auritidibacter sp. NML120636 TaxID=2170743 RepID=UPI002100D395|nr:AMP-binding protein [Auritidibacter sp. NML120636]